MANEYDLAGCFPGAESVSRETIEKLRRHLELVGKWNPAINLVARSTLPEGWSRHVRDSAQILALAPESPRLWLDLGSGGGFPGLVVAILLAERAPGCRLRLVESDLRKATFLREAARSCGIAADVVTDRAESLAPAKADVVSARALAPLADLCALAHRHLVPEGRAIFLKGREHLAELDLASLQWAFTSTLRPSITDPAAAVVALESLRHV
ncbi:16S rRNA (guanine(527)-N(7))-methyltransferase RsmG [Neotabrizicola shimadae]|uniref:Ribosomal RNA small subunit methyltransferase G n=2 Tax=Neotabrizicola shimadae TaxID=2807096 RepID=A0A8G0ZXJ3_9RHOB|nr:16S rRNA (guanine(527)-N(7))-methyltransferase RsmG [Neotabrizicola shimadae]